MIHAQLPDLVNAAIAVAALLSPAIAAPLGDQKPKGFLKELGNSTWVIGNEIWNVTQNRQYADQLWYKGEDRVGDAVGHYVSYSKSTLHLRHQLAYS